MFPSLYKKSAADFSGFYKWFMCLFCAQHMSGEYEVSWLSNRYVLIDDVWIGKFTNNRFLNAEELIKLTCMHALNGNHTVRAGEPSSLSLKCLIKQKLCRQSTVPLSLQRREWILNVRLSLFGWEKPQSQTARQIPRKNSFSFPCLIIFSLDETENNFSHAIRFSLLSRWRHSSAFWTKCLWSSLNSTKHDTRFMNFR